MKIQSPPGMRDFYPQDMRVQNWLFDAWRRASRAFGFSEYEGPIFEYLDLYTLKSGEARIVSAETLEAMDRSPLHFASWSPLPENGPMTVGDFSIECFPVPHDAARPVGFVVRGEGLRLAMVTDLGHATTLVLERLRGSQLIMIESNHDEEMLRNGPYPWQLKQRA